MSGVIRSGNVLSDILILFQLVGCVIGQNPISVLRSGVEPLGQEPTAITFFVTAMNRGSQAVALGLEMEKCCQKVTSNDTDCESMALHNGLRLEFHPGDVRNLTMFFTNRYVHGRVGDCWLKLKWRTVVNGFSTDRVQIHFETEPFLPNSMQKLLYLFPGSTGSVCESVDEDPGRGCLPVNCLLKYSGFRSFYNRTRRKCQSSPTCLDRSKLTLETERKPNIILSPNSNKCKNIKTGVKFNEEMRQLQDVVEVSALSYQKYPVGIKCVHGHRDGATDDLCICDPGWTSRNFSAARFNPENDTYIKCDLPLGGSRRMASSSLIVLVGMLVILVVVLCLYLPFAFRRYITRRRIEALSSELASSSSSSESGSEISLASSKKSTRGVTPPPPTPNKSKMVEFSRLVREEQTTRPAPSKPRQVAFEQPQQVKPLRFPENFQLKPRPQLSQPNLQGLISDRGGLTPSRSRSRSRPPQPQPYRETAHRPTLPLPRSRSPLQLQEWAQYKAPTSSMTSPVSDAFSHDRLVEPKWSIPDTSEYGPCQASLAKSVPLSCSLSSDAFPRRAVICSCSYCSNEAERPLLSIKVNSDFNRNTILTLRKFSSSDTCLCFENIQFPGPSPQSIQEVATLKWKKQLDVFLETFKPEIDLSSTRTSSTLSTLSEFWREDEESAKIPKEPINGNDSLITKGPDSSWALNLDSFN